MTTLTYASCLLFLVRLLIMAPKIEAVWIIQQLFCVASTPSLIACVCAWENMMAINQPWTISIIFVSCANIYIIRTWWSLKEIHKPFFSQIESLCDTGLQAGGVEIVPPPPPPAPRGFLSYDVSRSATRWPNYVISVIFNSDCVKHFARSL